LTDGRFFPVIFSDENTAQVGPASCCATWPAGLLPPVEPIPGTCSNNSVHVSFPSGTYNGVASLYIQLAHRYEDDRLVRLQRSACAADTFKKLINNLHSVGQAPYNVITLFGGVNLTYGGDGSPGTPNYECDMSTAKCRSSSNAVIIGEVTEAVA
jgi:hypothetical protein